MPRGGKGRKNKQGSRESADSVMARTLDELAQFEEFRKEIAPSLQQDVQNKLPAEELFRKYSTMAAARGIQIAMTERDSSKALAAIKEILAYDIGKPKERSEVTHKYSKLPDDQLDALILSMAEDGDPDSEVNRSKKH